jgi:hypothetical protein
VNRSPGMRRRQRRPQIRCAQRYTSSQGGVLDGRRRAGGAVQTKRIARRGVLWQRKIPTYKFQFCCLGSVGKLPTRARAGPGRYGRHHSDLGDAGEEGCSQMRSRPARRKRRALRTGAVSFAALRLHEPPGQFSTLDGERRDLVAKGCLHTQHRFKSAVRKLAIISE